MTNRARPALNVLDRSSSLKLVYYPLRRRILDRITSSAALVLSNQKGSLVESSREEQFARNFIVAEKRQRYLSLLESERGRKKLLAGFHHCRDLDTQFAKVIPSNQQSSQSIELLLKSNGASNICYVMSENLSLDGKEVDLNKALLEIVGADAGALVSCIPGKLAYFEMEGFNERYLLSK